MYELLALVDSWNQNFCILRSKQIYIILIVLVEK